MQKKHLIALILLAMKISIVQLTLAIIFTCSVYANELNAQALLNKTITVSVEQTELKKVISSLQEQTGVKFIYSSKAIHAEQKIKCNLTNAKLSQFIEAVLKPLNIAYKIVEDKVLLYPVDVAMTPQTTQQIYYQAMAEQADVKGIIKNEKGEALAGAAVQLKNTNYSAITDGSGAFVIRNVPVNNYTLTVSYIGYISKEVPVIVGANMQSVEVKLSEDVLQLQQVVVTGGNPKKKIESSVAIATMSNRQMQVRAPLNSADMLKFIPGLWVESSGGDGPGNTAVRGLPSTNGYQFMTIMEDGLPVIPAGFGSVPSADQYFKSDLTIRNVEAIRGGSAPILVFNSAGAVVNNLSYTGAAKQYGAVKFTTGLSQGLYKIEGNTGGKLDKNDKWEYNVGGVYRTDQGIRPTSFTPNKGGQFKANLTYKLKNNSFIRFYGKYLNDKTQWLEPGYYSYNTGRKVVALPQYDLFTQSLVSSDTKFNVTLPEGNDYTFDLSNGYHTKSWYGGLLANFKTKGNWTIKNNFRYQRTNVSANYAFISGAVGYDAAKSYYYLDGTQLTNPTGYYSNQSFTGTNFTDVQIVDYLDFSKKIGNHNISFGTGIYSYDILNTESLSFVAATEIKPQPRRLLINTNTGNGVTPIYRASPGGHTKSNGKTFITSLYVNDEITLGRKWRLDAGIRTDHVNIVGNKATYTQGANGYEITGKVPFEKNKIYWAASAGVNYKVSESYAMYARATRAYNAINIGDLSSLTVDPNRLQNRIIYLAEIGAKYAHNNLSFFGSLIYSNASNMPFNHNIPTATGGTVGQSTFGSSRTYSLELEASYRLLKGLNLRLVTTFQDSKYTNYEFDVTAVGVRPDLEGKHIVWTDNVVARIPKVNFQVSADYEYKFFNAFANFNHYGKRWSTAANTYELSAYNELNAGLGFKITKTLELRGWVNNLLNSRGLTEGNTRGDQFLDPSTLRVGDLMIGRTILPRSIWASVAFNF